MVDGDDTYLCIGEWYKEQRTCHSELDCAALGVSEIGILVRIRIQLLSWSCITGRHDTYFKCQ